MMKRNLTIGAMIIPTLLLAACNTEKKEETVKTEEQSTDKKSANKTDNKTSTATEEKQDDIKSSIDTEALKNIDTLSDDFKNEFESNNQIGYKGLVKGLTFKEVKAAMGDFEIKNLYYKNHGVVFQEYPNIEIIFGDGSEGVPSDNEKISTIYFNQNGTLIPMEDLEPVWGTPKHTGFWVGGIFLKYYENPDGTYTEVEIGRGEYSGVRKLTKEQYTEALRSSYTVSDTDLTLNVMHHNVAEGLISNFFSIENVKVGSDASAVTELFGNGSKEIGKYSVDEDGDIVTKVAMDISGDKINIEQLREFWGSKYTEENDGDQIVTIYDVQPDDGYVTKAISDSNGIVQEVGVYSDDYSESSSDSSGDASSSENVVDDANIDMVDGIAHYNLPDITTFKFGYQFCTNNFEILGYKVGDDAGDLIEQLGDTVEEKSGRSGSHTYVYDNFEVSIKDGKVFSYIMQPTDQYPEFVSLAGQWDSSPDFEDEHHMRFDNNKTNGFYVEVYDNGEGLVNGIAIFGENYSGR
ncbi:hypothetical protein [Macrococcus epidermidis]|uniref:hypothetical protein n=1 Tax=Macrococcus epidermidis TaxID=1902580 RepID=UPI0020B733C3|nr:hypothetical protein [Macrococcus epidermidis]UTH16743.1 hypothetical protein KFV12_02935 [Macrococcus epidermidis]